MEEIIGYVIIFVVGLSVLYAYQWKKSKKRELPLSVQQYADVLLELLIQKQHGKTQELLLKVTAKTDVTLAHVSIELININRQIDILKLQGIFKQPNDIITLEKGMQHIFHFVPESLKKFISEQGKAFRTFRFVVENDNGKKYKTHEMAFNKNWSIFKPDSGRYN